MRRFCHRSVWDVEALVAVLQYTGFRAVQRKFDVSALVPCPTRPKRRHASVYVEGWKER